jgi:hypothetical protein
MPWALLIFTIWIFCKYCSQFHTFRALIGSINILRRPTNAVGYINVILLHWYVGYLSAVRVAIYRFVRTRIQLHLMFRKELTLKNHIILLKTTVSWSIQSRMSKTFYVWRPVVICNWNRIFIMSDDGFWIKPNRLYSTEQDNKTQQWCGC